MMKDSFISSPEISAHNSSVNQLDKSELFDNNQTNSRSDLSRFSQDTQSKISSILEALHQRNPERADVLEREFLEFVEYLNNRSERLKNMYPSQDKIEPQFKEQSDLLLLKIEGRVLQDNLRDPRFLSFAKSYLFCRNYHLPFMKYSRGEISKNYPNLENAFDTMEAMSDEIFVQSYWDELDSRLRKILGDSHGREQRSQADLRNKSALGGVIIQPGDLLHGSSSSRVTDVLVNGLWCPELRVAKGIDMGANHLAVVCGESTGAINLNIAQEVSRHLKDVNPIIYTTLYPRGGQIIDNDSFFIQYSGNMASLYGPMEPELVVLKAIPKNFVSGIDDRKAGNKSEGITYLIRPQNEKFKGRGNMDVYTSTEVDIPLGIASTDIKGIVVNGMNKNEADSVLQGVAANDFYIPIYDCVTGDLLNPFVK